MLGCGGPFGFTGGASPCENGSLGSGAGAEVRKAGLPHLLFMKNCLLTTPLGFLYWLLSGHILV